MDPDSSLLISILGFLASAIAVVFLFRRMKISPILGYIVAGMLIGPNLIGVVQDPKDVQFLGEIGVLFLLFTIGLELPLQRLQSLKQYVFGLGISQVFITGTIFTLIGIAVGFSKETALLVGAALALSSTAVVLQVLVDRRELATQFGRVSFSVLILQDLAVVLLLILTTTLGKEGSNIFIELSFATVKAIVVLLAIVGLGRFVFRPLYRVVALSGNPELFMATTFFVILGTAFLTEVSGLSRELGAFLAGILLAETEYRHQIEADIQPFRGLLLGVFFISVGMAINLNVLIGTYQIVLGLLVFLVVLKALLTFLISRISGLRMSTSLKVSLLLAGGGEFVFVIFSPTVAQKFLPPGFADVLFSVVILSMALTPFLAMLAKKWADHYLIQETQSEPKLEMEDGRELENHIIIAGFGRVGQMLAEILAARLIPFVAIDIDMQRVIEGREKGYPVFYGDARRLPVLKGIGAEQAKAVVITLNQLTPSVRTVMTFRRHFPDLPICVRVKDHKHQERLVESGARLVVPETVEPTIQLATSVLHVMGMPSDEIGQLMDTFRRQQWMSSQEKEAE